MVYTPAVPALFYCLFIHQQMAASALHADRLSVTGRNGQISAAQSFCCTLKPNHTLLRTHRHRYPTRTMSAFDISGSARVPPRAHTNKLKRGFWKPPDNMQSQQNSIQKLNKYRTATKRRGIKQPLLGSAMLGLNGTANRIIS